MNEFKLLTLGAVVLQDMIVFLFNMIPTNQVSVGCTSRDYTIFFSIHHNKTHFPCALVSWYSTISNTPCVDTGMWKIWPDFNNTSDVLAPAWPESPGFGLALGCLGLRKL